MPPTAEVTAKVSPARSYPELFQVTGSLLSLVFRTEDVCQRCNQFIETAEFLIRVSPARSYNAGRAGLVDGGLCTRHTVMVWCFVTRLPDTLDDSDPSTRGLYSRPFQLCVLKIRVRYVFALCVTRASSYQCITSFTVIQSLYPVCIETPILRFLRVQIIVSCSTLSCSSVVFEQSLSLVVTLSASFLVV